VLTLRPYQTALIAQCCAAMQQGARRVLIQSPTGSGKTALVAQMLASAAARGKRAWFCVHRRELLDQSVETFIESADIHTGIVCAGYPQSPLAPVQVCSVPSLARRSAALAPPDLIVWDEAHHVASKTWSTLHAQFPLALHIGLTATPQRLDGQGLGAHFDTLIQGPTVAQLTAQGWLSPYRYYAPTLTDLSAVHRVAGDYNKRETADVMERSTVVGDAVAHYQQYGNSGRALVFAWSIEASKDIAASFLAAGVEAEHVDGETGRSVRADAMRRFRLGSLRVLCNVDLFGEGLDVPAVDCVFLLRPTASLGLYLQQVGRGLRPAQDKSFVRIFDHVNNWQRHGLPDDERHWSLDGTPRASRTSEPMGKRCAVCFGVSRVGAVRCALCGAVFPVKARAVQQVKGELQAVDVDVLRQLGLASGEPRRRVCQRCGKPCEKRFCGSVCYLAARRLWKRSA
jgi:DNA repair protein RadD